MILLKPHPRLRRGVTLVEVLISMGILTLGLLGVAALFPVGSHFLQRADLYDRADAVAQAAFNDAVTRGLLDPERWVGFQGPMFGAPGAFTRPFASDLREGLSVRERGIGSAGGFQAQAQFGQALNQEIGFAYVIDPYAAAVAEGPPRSNLLIGTVASQMGVVPAAANPRAKSPGAPNSTQASWYPWSSQPYAMTESTVLWPVRRLSVATRYVDGTPLRMDAPTSQNLMSLMDDLSFERPDNADMPSQQLMATTAGDGLARLNRGEYSYILSVVPHNLAARDALAYGGSGQQYDVSAVVFRRRVTGGEFNGQSSLFDADLNGHVDAYLNERIARAAVVASSPSGGVLQLTDDAATSSPVAKIENFRVDEKEPRFENLKVGEYVMLVGPHPSSTSARPILFLQWYRVLSLNPVTNTNGAIIDVDMNGEPDSVEIAVRGPDWPWEPGVGIANDLRVVILPGAVAVHTRTMRLDAGAAWAAE